VAPIDGVVVQRQTEAGTTVVTGTPILRLVDPATLWVAMRADESVVSRVQIGQNARLQLCSGEHQRVAIGRAIANAPALMLADEPTAALDTERGMKALALLRKIARERHSAVITVTHGHRMIEGFDTDFRLDSAALTRRTQPSSPA
jgi:ABC-type lipoprotein export system ATPase subunit